MALSPLLSLRNVLITLSLINLLCKQLNKPHLFLLFLKRLLAEAMDAGACGWSSQTLGTPGDPTAPGFVGEWLAYGASVRAAQQLVLGGKGLKNGIIEAKDRKTGDKIELPLDGFAEAEAVQLGTEELLVVHAREHGVVLCGGVLGVGLEQARRGGHVEPFACRNAGVIVDDREDLVVFAY